MAQFFKSAGAAVVKSFKLRLLDGLFVLVPIAVVLFVAGFVYNLGERIAELCLYPFYRPGNGAALWLKILVEGVIPIAMVAGALILVSLVGTAWRNRAIRFCVDMFGRLVSDVPAIGTIYRASRQLVKQLVQGGDNQAERKLVWLWLKAMGIWQVGVVVEEFPNGLTTVFLPMALNVTNGYALIMPTEQLRPCALSFTEMMEFYCSGAFAMSEQMKKEIAALPKDGA